MEKITFAADWRDKLASRARSRADRKRAEIRKKLENEMVWRTKQQRKNQHGVEKISSMEKERAQMPEWLRRAMAELQVGLICFCLDFVQRVVLDYEV